MGCKASRALGFRSLGPRAFGVFNSLEPGLGFQGLGFIGFRVIRFRVRGLGFRVSGYKV